MRLRWGLCTMLAASLMGCTPPAERPGAQASLATDEFSKSIDVVGPLEVHNPFFGVKDSYQLVTHIDKQTHAIGQTIELEVSYNGTFYYFQYAADDTSQSLRLIPIKRARNTAIGDRVEDFDILVPDASLRAHATTGYRVKISTRDATYYIIEISPAMIAAQYEGMTKILGPSVALQLGSPPAALVTANSTTFPSPRPVNAADGPLLGIAPFDLPFGVGVQVNRVDPNTPAAAAGLQVGDLVQSYNGQAVTGADQLRSLIAQTRPGSVVPIEVKRHGQPMTLSAQM